MYLRKFKMTETEIKKLVDLKQTLMGMVHDDHELTKGEEFQKMDSLNKDLLITQLNAMQTVVGILTVRIGLNISNVQVADTAAPEDADKGEKVSANEESPAEEGPKSE